MIEVEVVFLLHVSIFGNNCWTVRDTDIIFTSIKVCLWSDKVKGCDLLLKLDCWFQKFSKKDVFIFTSLVGIMKTLSKIAFWWQVKGHDPFTKHSDITTKKWYFVSQEQFEKCVMLDVNILHHVLSSKKVLDLCFPMGLWSQRASYVTKNR